MQKIFNILGVFRLKKTWQYYVLIALISILPYIHVLFYTNYTHYDDHYLIVECHKFIDEWSDIGRAFLEDVGHQSQGGNLYRPILTISFILSEKISGISPFGYHILDLFFHAIACCLLFLFLQKVGFDKTKSLLATILFSIHPANSQAVAWIAGRNDTLLAIFVLSSVITFINYFNTLKIKWYLWHTVFFFFAMFTKETSLILPFIFICYLFYILKNDFRKYLIHILLFTVGWILILANWHILRSAAMIANVASISGAIQKIILNMWIGLYYFGKIFFPVDLAFGPISADMNLLYGILATIIFYVLIYYSKKNYWIIAFGIIWFVGFLAPTFYYHTETSGPAKFYEHRLYVPFIGILIILLSLDYKTIFSKKYVITAFVILCFGFIYASHINTYNFKDTMTLLEYDAASSPQDPRVFKSHQLDNTFLMDSLYNYYNAQNKNCNPNKILLKVIDDLNKNIHNYSCRNDFYHTLAIANFKRGYLLASEKYFLKAIDSDSLNPKIFFNLGILYYASKKYQESINSWNNAITLDPHMAKAYHNLSYIYYEIGKCDLALLNYEKAVSNGIERMVVYEQSLKDCK